MSATRQLDQYLAAFRQRLRKLTLMQGIAASSLVLLVVAVLAAWFARESGNDAATVNGMRLLILAALAIVIFIAIVRPLKKLRAGIADRVEQRSPAFQGRIETYQDLKETDNPLADLLAEDTLRVSRRHPVETQVTPREFGLAGAVTGLALFAFICMIVIGPGMLNYSLRNVLAGWAIGDILPPQMITVTPGDQSIRLGANLRIHSHMEGFDPDRATLHVRPEGASWQEVAMVQGPEGFEFTFFAVQEAMQYYVSAAGMRSPAFDVEVVELPNLEDLRLTYHYPDWSQREPETFENQGDINALAETRIELTAITSSPLPGGRLILNQEEQPLQLEGNQASTEFTVSEPGEYYLAAVVGNDAVRLSDDYFIRITEDGRPSIEFTQPARDWNASNIEEVMTRVTAQDDFGLERVSLSYSVNGGDWQRVDLSHEQEREVSVEHLFMLEELRTPLRVAPSGTQVGAFNIVVDEASGSIDTSEAAAPAPMMVPLQPGDVVAYYAEAEDRNATARTDMFFIQIQPYHRRYSQSQMSGGGGGQQGGPQDEISQRQRQIIVSTWNLIRDAEAGGETGPIQVSSSMLSELQNTLASQATTLAERTRARQLTRQDADIETFVENMEMAVAAMQPAAQHLSGVELNEAIQPAQEALQHLLRAEAVFNDMTISQQQQGGGGGGGQAQRDLAEMFELELDMEKNQYETGNRANRQSPQQAAEDLMKQLDELAQRQQQLADNLRNQERLSDAQRWQQEMLRREAEQLREQLEQLPSQNQDGQQQGQQTAGNQQGEGQAGQGQQGEQIARNELQRRLDSAIRAMNEAGDSNNELGGTSPEARQRAAEEAQRQLQGAREEVAREQQESMRGAFANMAEQSDAMLREQQRMHRQLQEAMQRAVAERESGENPESRGMSLAAEWQLAREKEDLAADLEQLRQQMLSTRQQFGNEIPQADQALERASQTLTESDVQQTISESALYIDNGYGLYIAGNEGSVTRTLESLNVELQRANRLVTQQDGTQQSERERAIAQAQDLRSQMREQQRQNRQGQSQQGQGQQAGQTPGEGQEPGQEQAQAGQSAQQAGQQPGQQAGTGQRGSLAGNAGGQWRQGPDSGNQPLELPEDFYQNLDNLTQSTREAIPEMNLGQETLNEMYEQIRELESTRANRNDTILAREYNNLLTLIEQLEVSLQTDQRSGERTNVRTALRETVPDEYRDNVAEYYRRLSETE